MDDARRQHKQLQRRLEAANEQAGAHLPQPGRAEALGGILDRVMSDIRSGGRGREAIVYRRDVPRSEAGPAPPPAALPHVELSEAVAGQEVEAPGGRRALLIQHRLSEMSDGWARLPDALRAALCRKGTNLRRHLRGVCDTPACEDIVFLDLETTALSNSPVFLIGTMAWQAGDLIVRQYFARDYSEERAILSLFLAAVANKTLLVSFNGKSFDLPYVRVRAAATGAAFAWSPAHLDLLHVSRRAWKGALPNCKLQTLERHICGRGRVGDIPGDQIPEAYHAFVRTQNAALMVRCLEHNRLDLMTLADLMTRLPPPRDK